MANGEKDRKGIVIGGSLFRENIVISVKIAFIGLLAFSAFVITSELADAGYLSLLTPYLIILVGFVVCFFGVLYSFSRQPHNIIIFYLSPSLFFYFFGIIFAFAVIYYKLGGIVDDSGAVVTEFSTCIYFSIVTFTTLGYGDFRPIAMTRGVAALEALLGYLSMGILIGVTVFLLTRQHVHERKIQKTPSRDIFISRRALFMIVIFMVAILSWSIYSLLSSLHMLI